MKREVSERGASQCEFSTRVRGRSQSHAPFVIRGARGPPVAGGGSGRCSSVRNSMKNGNLEDERNLPDEPTASEGCIDT